ncbi:MAG: hypothetical protein R3C39_14780 [Dehalococcoidia bacterium]
MYDPKPAWWFDPEERDVPAPELGLTTRFMDPERLTEEQEQHMLRLLELAFNGGPAWFELPVSRADHWRWKLHDYPGPTRAELMLRTNGSDAPPPPPGPEPSAIIGMAAERWRPWLMQGRPRPMRNSVDLAVDPSYQGRGIQGRRRDWHHQHGEFDHNDVSISTNTHPTARHISMRQGYRPVSNGLSIFTMPLNPSALAAPPPPPTPGASRTMVAITAEARTRPQAVRWLGWHARWLRSRARYELGRSRTTNPWTIETRPNFDDRIDGLLHAFSADFDVIYLRDREYLNWRYADPRGGPFTIRTAEANGELLGYAVTRAWSRRSELADVVAQPGRTDVATSLIDDAIQLARAAGSRRLRAWLPERHPYAPAFRSHGFREDATPGRLLYGGPSMDEYSFLKSPDLRLHYVLGDTDAI